MSKNKVGSVFSFTYSLDFDGTNNYVNAVSPSALSNVEGISVWYIAGWLQCN